MQSGSSARGSRRRPALIALVVVAAAACLALAWWQWDVYESSAGTAQNLGYALQWPAFAAAVIWAYRRFVVLESNPDEQAKLTESKGATEIPAGILPDRPTTPSASSLRSTTAPDDDSALADYNSYLADLRRSDASQPSSEEQRR